MIVGALWACDLHAGKNISKQAMHIVEGFPFINGYQWATKTISWRSKYELKCNVCNARFFGSRLSIIMRP